MRRTVDVELEGGDRASRAGSGCWTNRGLEPASSRLKLCMALFACCQSHSSGGHRTPSTLLSAALAQSRPSHPSNFASAHAARPGPSAAAATWPRPPSFLQPSAQLSIAYLRVCRPVAGRCPGSRPPISLDYCHQNGPKYNWTLADALLPTPSDCSTPCRTAVAQQPPQVSQVLFRLCLIRHSPSGNLFSARGRTSRVLSYASPTPDPNWEGMIEGGAKHADDSRQDGRLTQSRSTFIAIPARWVSPVYQHDPPTIDTHAPYRSRWAYKAGFD